MALSISPSQSFLGNDGAWSTFNLEIGEPGQRLQVLPATSQSLAFAVLPDGCPSDSALTPDACAKSRGGIWNSSLDRNFNVQTSADFGSSASVSLPLNYSTYSNQSSVAAEVGYDALTLDWTGATAPNGSLPNQLVAGYATPSPWIGMIGLSGRLLHLYGNQSSQSNLLSDAVNNTETGTSLSWAYTAGAHYKSPPAFGSLIFSGYDAARFNLTDAVTIPFDSNPSRNLTLALTQISVDAVSSTASGGDGGSSWAAQQALRPFIDSVPAEICLPVDACRYFETALGITWNDTLQIYLVNDSLHETLSLTKPNITFSFAKSVSTTVSSLIEIALPYAAFDHNVSFPVAGITDNTTSLRYFPLKRAANASDIYFGRTFLQEVYVIADYDRSVFHIGPAIFPNESSGADIQTLYKPASYKAGKAPIGRIVGTYVGIILGSLIGGAICAFVIYWLIRRRRRRRRQARQPHESPQDHGEDKTNFYDKAELDGTIESGPQLNEVGADGDITEVHSEHKVLEADHAHILAELPGDWAGHEVPISPTRTHSHRKQ